jgi:HlyD family secretion protein
MGVKVAFEGPDEKVETKKGPEVKAFIPKTAVHSDSGASYVFLVKDGKLERRAVTLGLDRGTDIAVMAGILPGDPLVVKGPENLKDGDKVEIR